MKKQVKRALVPGAVLLLLLAGALVQWRTIARPIRDVENSAVVDELTVDLRGVQAQNDFPMRNDSGVYQALAAYLTQGIYLPCWNQDTFSLGETSRSVTLRYAGSLSEPAVLALTFYDGTSICQVNGRKARFFSPKGADAYQTIQNLLRTECDAVTLTVTKIQPDFDCLDAEDPATGNAYSLGAVSEKLQAPDGTAVPLDTLAVGDTVTVLCDGALLMTYPYQFSSVYCIQTAR